jgi:hypothetical protein
MFNIGTAIGSLNTLKRGVFISMNGRTYEAQRCTRDPTTGAFIGETLTRPGLNRPVESAKPRHDVVISDDDGDDESEIAFEESSMSGAVTVVPSQVLVKKLNLSSNDSVSNVLNSSGAMESHGRTRKAVRARKSSSEKKIVS